jgi:hypothetical protein
MLIKLNITTFTVKLVHKDFIQNSTDTEIEELEYEVGMMMEGLKADLYNRIKEAGYEELLKVETRQ